MELGYCLNMIAQDGYGIGYDRIPQVRDAGFDYVELPVAQMMALDDGQFEHLILENLDRAGMRCRTCNNFFPASHRLTGPAADHDAAWRYAEKAAARMRRLGAESVVFGSSGARNRPAGYPREQAFDQLISFLTGLSPILRDSGIRVAIEPLNISEANLINTYREVLTLARAVDCDNIMALADTYHMRLSGEALKDVALGGSLLRHVHIAQPLGRGIPSPDDEEDYAGLFEAFRSVGYDRTVSVEAYLKPGQGTEDLARTASLLHGYMSGR